MKNKIDNGSALVEKKDCKHETCKDCNHVSTSGIYYLNIARYHKHFITLMSFSLQIHAKTRFKASKKIEVICTLLKTQFKIEFLPRGTGYPIDL